MKTGVYQIRNLTNGKFYIGSASASGGITGRWSDHKLDLFKNKHHSSKLQRAWNKYGNKAFVFEILEECEPGRCIEREQYYLDTLLFASYNDSRFNKLGYNICRVAENTAGERPFLGKQHSKEAKLKMSIAKIGEVHPSAKLTNNSVFEIKTFLDMGIKGSDIAKIFDVHRNTISQIKLGKRWSHV